MTCVYICHPLTNTGPGGEEANVQRYLRVVHHAMLNGHTVLTWIHHHLLNKDHPQPGVYWLEHDAELIRKADEVWLCLDDKGELPDSVGMRAEERMARTFGKKMRWVTIDDDAIHVTHPRSSPSSVDSVLSIILEVASYEYGAKAAERVPDMVCEWCELALVAGTTSEGRPIWRTRSGEACRKDPGLPDVFGPHKPIPVSAIW